VIASLVADCDRVGLRGKPRGGQECGGGSATAEGIDRLSLQYSLLSEERRYRGQQFRVGNAASFQDISDERWSSSIAINLMGRPICRALLPQMAKRGSGSVGEHRFRSRQATGAHHEWTMGCRQAALSHQGPGQTVCSACALNVVLPGPIWSRMWTRPVDWSIKLVANYGVDKESSGVNDFWKTILPLASGNRKT